MALLLQVFLIVSMAKLYYFAPTQDEHIEQCKVDSVCSNGHYCYMQMYCEPCIPCEKTFNRQPARLPSLEITCAKHEDDCGNCIPGFHAEDMTHGRRAMKCFKIEHSAVSSDGPVLLNEASPISEISILFIIAGFFTMGVASYMYKCIRQNDSRLRPTWTGIELENIIPSALALPENQAKSEDGTKETDQLVSAISTRQMVDVQFEDDNLIGADPIGRFHTYEQPSETSRPTAPTLEDIEDINLGNNVQSNDDPAEFVPVIFREPSPPTNNASQPLELLLDDGPHTATENYSSSDIAILPPSTSGSRNPDEEQSRRRRSSQAEESLELGIAVCLWINRFKRETENE